MLDREPYSLLKKGGKGMGGMSGGGGPQRMQLKQCRGKPWRGPEELSLGGMFGRRLTGILKVQKEKELSSNRHRSKIGGKGWSWGSRRSNREETVLRRDPVPRPGETKGGSRKLAVCTRGERR